MTKKEIEKLIDENKNIVYKICKKYKREIREELEIIGIEELWYCITRFDESKNVKFSTYAWNCIDKKIKQYFSAMTTGSTTYNSLINKTARIIYNNKDKSKQEIYDKVREIGMGRESFEILYNTISSNNVQEFNNEPIDNCNNIEKLEQELYIDYVRDKIDEVTKRMDERNVLLYKEWFEYAIEGDSFRAMTILAEKHGISRQRVNAIVTSVNQKLRNIIKEDY